MDFSSRKYFHSTSEVGSSLFALVTADNIILIMCVVTHLCDNCIQLQWMRNDRTINK